MCPNAKIESVVVLNEQWDYAHIKTTHEMHASSFCFEALPGVMGNEGKCHLFQGNRGTQV